MLSLYKSESLLSKKLTHFSMLIKRAIFTYLLSYICKCKVQNKQKPELVEWNVYFHNKDMYPDPFPMQLIVQCPVHPPNREKDWSESE